MKIKSYDELVCMGIEPRPFEVIYPGGIPLHRYYRSIVLNISAMTVQSGTSPNSTTITFVLGNGISIPLQCGTGFTASAPLYQDIITLYTGVVPVEISEFTMQFAPGSSLRTGSPHLLCVPF